MSSNVTVVDPPPIAPEVDELYDDLMSGKSGEEFEIKKSELEQLKVALKDETFRKMLSNYVEEVRDPENQKTYQSELCQLEREHGNIIHFINPIAGYVLKSSINGEQKGFINICSNPLVKKPSFEIGFQDNKQGSFWSIPYTQSPEREDYDNAGQKCMVYDVIFNPDALELAKRNSDLQQKLEQTAIEAVEQSFKVTLDRINIRRPKLRYKGMRNAITIKYKIGEAPPHVIDLSQIGKEPPPEKDGQGLQNLCETGSSTTKTKENEEKSYSSHPSAVSILDGSPPISIDYSGWTVPKFSVKFRSHIDMQDFCTEFQRLNLNANVPDELILTVDLPLLKDSSTLHADVVDDGNVFELKSDEKALYYLKTKFPYRVIPDSAKATFDKDKRKLEVSLKIIKNCNMQFSPAKPLISNQPGENDNRDSSNSHATDSAFDEPIMESSADGNLNLALQPLLEDPYEDSGDGTPEPESSFFGSPPEKKTVRFNDQVKRQIYRSNSSILGQRKKNQRKSRNKKNSRERLNSVESISSFDEDDDGGIGDACRASMTVRERFNSGESVSSFDDEENHEKYSSNY